MPHPTFSRWCLKVHLILLLCLLLLTIDKSHSQPNYHRENDSSNHTGNAHLRTKNTPGKDNRENADGRPRVEKSNSWSQSRSTLIYASKQRKNSARAYRQYCTRNRSHGVRKPSVGISTKIADNRSLTYKNGYHPCNEECRQQTKDNMFLSIPFR